MLIYEYPLNERVRIYLRLEYLLQQVQILIGRSSPLDHHSALTSIFQIIDLASRNDLRGEMLRDLERQRQTLNSYSTNPDIDKAVLNPILQNLQTGLDDLDAQNGRMGQVLVEDEWLNSVRNRSSIPGGTCAFDLPAYAAWQRLPEQERQADLQLWFKNFLVYARNLNLLLNLIRDCAIQRRVTTKNKTYQQALPAERAYQYAVVYLPEGSRVYPLISGTRMMLSIRFQNLISATHASGTHSQALREELEFELGLGT